jgi:hypothetical protein
MENDRGEAEIGRSGRLRNVAMVITVKWWPIKAFETLVPQTAASHSRATETSFFSGSPPFSISPEWHRSRGRTLSKVRLPPAKSESMAKSRMMVRGISLLRHGAFFTLQVQVLCHLILPYRAFRLSGSKTFMHSCFFSFSNVLFVLMIPNTSISLLS